ncbi:SWIM zinc finger family protein [Hydrogenophaga sp. MI9]|uniref:SWIM zinc finger family protein n=1 Tax=Hydrogenophaga sp. MI9 TaxID=3453719 RepID=UPI003EE90FB7
MSALAEAPLPTGYRAASRLDAGQLVLETALGLTPAGLVAHPVFFAGPVQRPDVAAGGLRALVEVASTRYFKPIPGGFASLDPVVTAQGDRLRCEAFSACNGVYARLDLLGQCLHEGALGYGTTNIDINPPLALALAGIGAQDALHLSVGPDAVSFRTDHGTHTEHRVALPERWVRALAETQGLARGMALRAELDAPAWRRFVQSLSTAGGSGAGPQLWLQPGPAGLRQTARPGAGAIALPGTARLTALRRLQHLVQRVRLYGPEVTAQTQAAVSAWEFELPGARLTLMLSPEPWRGFSGEGAVLAALSAAERDDAQTLAALLAWDAHIDPAALATETGLPHRRVDAALAWLAASGQVGWDLREAAYFHRQLPYAEERVQRNYPRLEGARALLVSGAVTTDGPGWTVQGEHGRYFLRRVAGRLQCTCLFEAKYQGSRGPCKHALAVQLFSGEATQPPPPP